jgi:hypothetical protein
MLNPRLVWRNGLKLTARVKRAPHRRHLHGFSIYGSFLCKPAFAADLLIQLLHPCSRHILCAGLLRSTLTVCTFLMELSVLTLLSISTVGNLITNPDLLKLL